MIELRDIVKTYNSSALQVEALRGVSLSIEQSDIFGVIGYSGAGKSTLVRCINLLEHPDSGRVVVDGIDITDQKEKELESTRQKIGMIFQHFNLMRSKTVFDNIALPLRYIGQSKAEISRRVGELLQLVGLEDKGKSYPSQLSGGQKQRVAIARALANNPKILLSDEATSALDPQATESILDLLKELNRKLGLTIVIITHEMNVVKDICNKIAVIEDGEIVESGEAYDVFSNPQSTTSKRFVEALFSTEKLERKLGALWRSRPLSEGSIYHLLFRGEKAYGGYISQAIARFDVNISIIYGNIEIIQSKPIGSLFVAAQGEAKNIEAMLDFFGREDVIARRMEFWAGAEEGNPNGVD